jgi:hypothetical protein
LAAHAVGLRADRRLRDWVTAQPSPSDRADVNRISHICNSSAGSCSSQRGRYDASRPLPSASIT